MLDRCSDEVSVVVFDAISVAVNGDVEVPYNGQRANVIRRINGLLCTHHTSLVSPTCKVLQPNNRWHIEHFDGKHLTGLCPIIIGDVVNDGVLTAAVPSVGQDITSDVTIIVCASKIIAIDAGVNVPTSNK